MFIELTNSISGKPIYLNTSSIVYFSDSSEGGTRIRVSREREDPLILTVNEEPYMVWAKIRAEENRS